MDHLDGDKVYIRNPHNNGLTADLFYVPIMDLAIYFPGEHIFYPPKSQ